MTQCERILRHLRDYGSITQAEAQAEYGVARLAARIDNLRERGHVIRSELVQGRNRYGEKTRYARYTLERENGGK